MNFVRKERNIQPEEKDENEPKNCLSNLKMLHFPQSPDIKESVLHFCKLQTKEAKLLQ